jgi:hypothetical protein
MILPTPTPPPPPWSLHPQLAHDTVSLGDLPLSRVLVVNDANWPWLLLVPRRLDVREIIDLDEVAQAQLMTEITRVARAAARRRMRQAQHRGARQCGVAAACPHHRAARGRCRLAPPSLGRRAFNRSRQKLARAIHGRITRRNLGHLESLSWIRCHARA